MERNNMKLIFKLLKWTIFLPITILLLIGSLFAADSKPAKAKAYKYDEKHFTRLLHEEHGFIEGKTQKLPERFQADLWTEDTVIEVDWESKMYEGLGQALTYSFYSDDYHPGIVILDDINKNVNFHKFLDVFRYHEVKVWIVQVNRETGTILNIESL